MTLPTALDERNGYDLTATRASFAHDLIECVLPEVDLRQWVLTFPFAWRRRLAQDGALLGKLTRIFVETVSAFYGKRAGDDGAKTGAVTVVQRTSGDLKLNPHLHVVLLDGAYSERGGDLVFRGLGHLRTREVGEVLERVVRRIARYLRRRGLFELLARTFAVDVLRCPTCDGGMKLLAMATDPKSVTRYLAKIGNDRTRQEPTPCPNGWRLVVLITTARELRQKARLHRMSAQPDRWRLRRFPRHSLRFGPRAARASLN